MGLKEIGMSTRNWVNSAQKVLESPCECGIEPPGSINHVVSLHLHDIMHIDYINKEMEDFSVSLVLDGETAYIATWEGARNGGYVIIAMTHHDKVSPTHSVTVPSTLLFSILCCMIIFTTL